MSKRVVNGIEYDLVRRKGMKNIRVVVKAPDGNVVVSAPMNMSTNAIEGFVESRAEWIARCQRKYRSLPKREPVDFIDGESFTLWGIERKLAIVEKTRGRKTHLEDNVLVLEVSPGANLEARRKAFEDYLRWTLGNAIDMIMPKWEEKTGLYCSGYQIRKMSSRWGSCTVKTRSIRFALRLAEYSPECLEMVIVHELGHIKYPDHGAGFKSYMDHNIPAWRSIQKNLI